MSTLRPVPTLRALLLALLATLALPAVLAEAAAPQNDRFADARPIVGALFSYHDKGTTVGAAMEPGEFGPCGLGASIWYSAGITSGFVGPMFVDTGGSDFDTVVAVWEGTSLSDLRLVACDDDMPGSKTTLLQFTALPTETYFIQIGGAKGATGKYVLEVY